MLKTHKNAAFAAEIPFNAEALVLQVARSTNEFHGKPLNGIS
jgi:hypothetical protein